MARQYVVKSGDTLTRIAAREGYASWRDIYYHPDNTAFRKKRPNPDRIFPGDLLMLPGKPGDPPSSESTRFKFILLGNFDKSHQPRAVITFSNGGIARTSSYRFEPLQFAHALETKIIPTEDGEPIIRTDFETPEPMTTQSFIGPVSLIQEFNNGNTAICRLFFRGNGKSGIQHVVRVNLSTNPESKDHIVTHGVMLLTEHSMPHQALLRASIPAPSLRF